MFRTAARSFGSQRVRSRLTMPLSLTRESGAGKPAKDASSSVDKSIAFDLQCCGTPTEWNRGENSGYWNNKAAKWFHRPGEQPVRPCIDKFLEFLAIRPDAEGNPISEKLGPPTFEKNGWFRLPWLELTADADADLAANGWQRAWHGSKIEALYSIMYYGYLTEGPRQLSGKPGVYAHKDSTQHKAENYCRFVPLMSDGVLWAIKWEVRANRQDFVANPGSDQWIQPERSIQLAALWVCGRNAAQMTNGSEVCWEWAPLKEMNPFSDELPTEMIRPQLDCTPPWRMNAATKASSAAKPAPPDYPPGTYAPWRSSAAKKISDVAKSASPMKATRSAKPAPPNYPPGTYAPWRMGAATKTSNAAESASPMKSTGAAKPAPPDCPPGTYALTDRLFEVLGERMNTGETERRVFAELVDDLWTGGLTMLPAGNNVLNRQTPHTAKARLEFLFQKAKSVRKYYQNRAKTLDTMIADVDFERSLTANETMVLHDLYMNDVASWMEPTALEKYDSLLREIQKFDCPENKRGRSNTAKRHWGHGKKNPAAKRVSEVCQQAQRMKRRCFDSMICESAVTKQLFMALVSRPTLMTVDGIMSLMEEVRDVKASEEYQELLRMSAKRADDDEKLKRALDELGVQHEKQNKVMQAWIRMQQEEMAGAYQ